MQSYHLTDEFTDIEAEQALLASLMQFPGLYWDLLDLLILEHSIEGIHSRLHRTSPFPTGCDHRTHFVGLPLIGDDLRYRCDTNHVRPRFFTRELHNFVLRA